MSLIYQLGWNTGPWTELYNLSGVHFVSQNGFNAFAERKIQVAGARPVGVVQLVLPPHVDTHQGEPVLANGPMLEVT